MSLGFNGCSCVFVCVCMRVHTSVGFCLTPLCRVVMSFGFNVLKNLYMYCEICSAPVLYINTCQPEVFLRGLFAPSSPPPFLHSFFSSRFSSQRTSSIQQVSNGLERHQGTACRIRFLPCSHSTQPPGERGGMEFICLRGFEQVCSFHHGAA